MLITPAWIFHLLLVPGAGVGAAVVATSHADGTLGFAVTFLIVAGWIAFIPVVRTWLDLRAARLGYPELFTPSMGVTQPEKHLRSFHVLFYSVYGTLALLRPANALATALLFLDAAISLIVYVSQVRASKGSPRALTEAAERAEADQFKVSEPKGWWCSGWFT
jgi:hypothetical protein